MRSATSRCTLDALQRWDQNAARRVWASFWNPRGRIVGPESGQWSGGWAQGLGWRDSSNMALVNPNMKGLCIECVEQEDTRTHQGWILDKGTVVSQVALVKGKHSKRLTNTMEKKAWSWESSSKKRTRGWRRTQWGFKLPVWEDWKKNKGSMAVVGPYANAIGAVPFLFNMEKDVLDSSSALGTWPWLYLP